MASRRNPFSSMFKPHPRISNLTNLTQLLNGTKDQRSLNRTSSPSLTRMVSSPSRLSMHNLETLENTNVSPPINWDLIPLIVLLLLKVHNTVATVFQQNLQMPNM